MTEDPSEQEPTTQAEPQPEPLKLDVPVYDYVEHGADSQAFETREAKPGESK